MGAGRLHIHRLLPKGSAASRHLTTPAHESGRRGRAPRPEDKEMQPIDEDRAVLLIESAENTEMYIPILTGLCPGLRRGELLAIRWTDLDLDNARLTINQSLSQTREGGWFFKSPKNKSSRRTITLPAALVDALREHREHQHGSKICSAGLSEVSSCHSAARRHTVPPESFY